MTHDVIASDREPHRRRLMMLGAVLVAAAVVSLLLWHSHSPPARDSATPTAHPAPSQLSADPSLPDLVIVAGGKLDEVTSGGDVRALADLPAGARDVWATTLPTSPAVASGDIAHVVHVFGLAKGHAFREDVSPDGVARSDLGPASAVLQTQEYPVLVRDGQPTTVGAPGGSHVALPAGWRPARFETLGYAGILIRPATDPGDVEIASWAPGGTPQPLTKAGELLGVTDGGQAMWLDPSCPDGPRCVLYFGDIGGTHPSYGLKAPSGTTYLVAPATYGGGSYVAAVAKRAGLPASVAGTPLLVLVEPWQATATIVAGSDDVVSAAGMFWSDGFRLIFARRTNGGVQLERYDVDTRRSVTFGPVLPADIHLLTAYGSVGGVTVRP